jgi:hypothetical protein
MSLCGDMPQFSLRVSYIRLEIADIPSPLDIRYFFGTFAKDGSYVEGLEEVGIVDLSGLAIGAHRIGNVCVVGVQHHHFVRRKRFPVRQKPLDTKERSKIKECVVFAKGYCGVSP